MAVKGDRDHARRERLIAALALGASQAEAARRSAYSTRQVRRLMADDEVMTAVEERRQELAGECYPDRTEQARTVRRMLKHLEAIADNADAKDADRIRAAKEVIGVLTSRRGPSEPVDRGAAPERHQQVEAPAEEPKAEGMPTISLEAARAQLG